MRDFMTGKCPLSSWSSTLSFVTWAAFIPHARDAALHFIPSTQYKKGVVSMKMPLCWEQRLKQLRNSSINHFRSRIRTIMNAKRLKIRQKDKRTSHTQSSDTLTMARQVIEFSEIKMADLISASTITFKLQLWAFLAYEPLRINFPMIPQTQTQTPHHKNIFLYCTALHACTWERESFVAVLVCCWSCRH